MTVDGPGFLSGDLEKEEFKRIQPRIRKTAPQFSLFGMLLRQETEPKIIYSYEHGFMQHNAMSWMTEGYGLAEYNHPSQTSQMLKNKLNNWIEGLDNDQRKTFIDMVFRILNETGMEKFGDPNVPMSEIIQVIWRELGKLDSSMRYFLLDLVKQFLQASEENKDPNAQKAEEASKNPSLKEYLSQAIFGEKEPPVMPWKKTAGAEDGNEKSKNEEDKDSSESKSLKNSDDIQLEKMGEDSKEEKEQDSLKNLMDKYDDLQ